MQIRTLDSVSFNAALSAYETHDAKLFQPDAQPPAPGLQAGRDGLAGAASAEESTRAAGPVLHAAVQDPAGGAGQRRSTPQSTAQFNHGQSAASTADNYVRLTVLLAAVLFLVGISSHFPVLGGRYGLLGLAGALLIFSIVQLLGLPGPP